MHSPDVTRGCLVNLLVDSTSRIAVTRLWIKPLISCPGLYRCATFSSSIAAGVQISSCIFLISSLLADLQLQTSLSCFQRAASSFAASSLCDRRYTYSRGIDICGIVVDSSTGSFVLDLICILTLDLFLRWILFAFFCFCSQVGLLLEWSRPTKKGRVVVSTNDCELKLNWKTTKCSPKLVSENSRRASSRSLY